MKSGGWFTLLVCLNLILATALVIFGLPPRTAVAQGTGLAGNYLVVSGEIQDQFDALYLIDLQERTLHTFYYQKGSNDIQYAGYRSLERDFRNR
jgi:hypothetical protein